jgi:hypothetical protein
MRFLVVVRRGLIRSHPGAMVEMAALPAFLMLRRERDRDRETQQPTE